MSIAGKIFRKLLPRPIGTSITSCKILESDYGHAYSNFKWASIDKHNNPIPWYTYPAIEYLKQLDFSNKTVFEYGSGNSTIFWSKLVKKIVSVEDNKTWYQKVSNKISNFQINNCSLKFIPEEESYIKEIVNHENFDVIIIDGHYRTKCAQEVIKKLNPGGLIILDNSDWWVDTAKILRNFNLIQIDMSGFGPINYYTWTTSLFLHREFNFLTKNHNQPEHGIGALKQYAQE